MTVDSVKYDNSKASDTSLQGSDVFTDYNLDITGVQGTSGSNNFDAFCVENSDAGTGDFEHILLPSQLNAAGYLADQYWNQGGSSSYSKDEYQIAIWEVAIDSSINLEGGTFTFNSGTNVTESNVVAILNSLPANPNPGSIVSLIHNPADGNTPSFPDGSQDFLINHKVPVPSALFLLGSGLFGLIGFGRKKLFS